MENEEIIYMNERWKCLKIFLAHSSSSVVDPTMDRSDSPESPLLPLLNVPLPSVETRCSVVFLHIGNIRQWTNLKN
jgi:hypothetical protein